MEAIARPPPPPRSYTETVQDDIEAATSSSFLLEPTRPRQTTGSTSAASAEYGLPAQRQTAVVVRLRETHDDHVGRPTTSLPFARSSSTATLRLPSATDETTGREAGGGGHAGLVRASSSATLLVRDDEDSDQDSDDSLGSDNESFRFRPPSVASTSPSQRSSRIGVRLEDWSDRPNAAFVRDVKIAGYHTVGADSSGFVVFDIELQTLPTAAQPQGTVMKIHKRYSAFVQLRRDLLAAHPQFRGLLPRLPPKSSLAKYRPSFLEKRRQRLGYWLATVLLHPIVGGTAVVRGWVLE
ncbi:hypothetical protein BMF94_3645 [Rhodotorula taiwanensis]|uniref:Endosomal/vacuolar adapter protein YPT35 n=1 Tax=Rhodotorula taiwanensis TaxID=741276 RepID=A0A2S5B955_9BASI|nr:hypothetical protein BMF94_3645 [Rhodotorula taiwanensis]